MVLLQEQVTGLAELVHWLLQRRSKVVVSDISEDAGYETVRLIQEQGGEAHFVKCNVAKEEEVKTLIDETLETFGKLDWAHNNAGI